jgi:hypothetical protein
LYALHVENCTSITFKDIDEIVHSIPRLSLLSISECCGDMKDVDVYRYHEMGIKISDTEDLLHALW